MFLIQGLRVLNSNYITQSKNSSDVIIIKPGRIRYLFVVSSKKKETNKQTPIVAEFKIQLNIHTFLLWQFNIHNSFLLVFTLYPFAMLIPMTQSTCCVPFRISLTAEPLWFSFKGQLLIGPRKVYYYLWGGYHHPTKSML